MSAPISREGAFHIAKRETLHRAIAQLALGIFFVALGPMLESFEILRGPLPVVTLLGGLVAMGFGLYSFIKSTRLAPGKVDVGAKGVRLGTTFIEKEKIRAAYFAPGSGHIASTVHLLGDGNRLLARVAVTDKVEGDRVLDALHLGPRQRTARFDAYAPKGSNARNAAWIAFAIGFLPMLGMFLLEAPGLVAFSAAIWIAGSAYLNPCTVEVGADGILIDTRISPTFIPWSDVAAIEPMDRGIRVRKKDGEIEIPVTPPGKLQNDLHRVQAKGLFVRAKEAFAAFNAGDAPDIAARVARRGRPHAEWIAELFDREGSFRTAPILDEQLWSIVESPSADASARAGAAAVLARSAGEGDRSRLRIAAEACTTPKLRIVLDRTASGASEAEVEQALVEIEADEDEAAEKQKARDAVL